jgi:hypothetical protein
MIYFAIFAIFYVFAGQLAALVETAGSAIPSNS